MFEADWMIDLQVAGMDNCKYEMLGAITSVSCSARSLVSIHADKLTF